MTQQNPLTRETVLSLAAAAGLDVDSAHIEELLPFAKNILASLQPLLDIDVSEAEPDMAFLPCGELPGGESPGGESPANSS